MSWIRSAVSKAVEVGGNNNLTRAVRSVADTVVNQAGQAVVGGAKLFGARNFQSYKLAVKRLEEVSVSCRGLERVQLLRRWLVAMKEIERLNESISTEHLNMTNESNDSPPNSTVVLYYDPDLDGEPMNFLEMFLLSRALEGITLSLILEQPNEEEISLLLEIFGLCLMGGKETQDVIVNCIRDLAKAFSTYDEEILAKREELLQYAKDAITGLKVNTEILRIDSEVSNIHKKLNDMKTQMLLNEGDKQSSEAGESVMSGENSEDALECIRLCSQLEELLKRKKLLNAGNSLAALNHQFVAVQVDKLKVLSESLGSSATKAERRFSENRTQNEDALNFRVTKTSEMGQLEKDLAAEIEALEKRKDELEAEMKKVSTALVSAHARIRNAREERVQFDEASDELIQHFKLKEEELSKSIASYRAEAEVCNTFVNFLENTSTFQSSYVDQIKKLVNGELERHEEYFVNFATSLLAAYKEELGPCISSLRETAENLKRLDGTGTTEETSDAVNSRTRLEEQYHTTYNRFLTKFSIVESIQKQFDTQQEKDSRKGSEKVKDLLSALEKIKKESESIEKPTSETDIPATSNDSPSLLRIPLLPFLSPRKPPKDKPFGSTNVESSSSSPSVKETQKGASSPFSPRVSLLNRTSESQTPESKQAGFLESLALTGKKPSDAEVQLSKLKMELELENHSRGGSMDGISDWEFDDKFEKETR